MTTRPDRFSNLTELAERHRAGGRLADADRTFRQAIRAAEEDFGDDHPTTTRLRSRLTRLLIDLGRDAEAAALEEGHGRHGRADEERDR